MDRELPIVITVVNPPQGVKFAVQRGKDELLPPSKVTSDTLVFELTLRVREGTGGQPNFLGPFAQGPASDRFIYVNSGVRAGQTATQWDRRAKISLAGITWKLLETARAVGVRIEGTGRDGGPVCASVKLPAGAWTAMD
jgi:hypothetical protein